MEETRYTAARLGRDLALHLPFVLRNAGQIRSGFKGFPRGTQQALMLRQAKLLGCPVCRKIFPGFARKAGLSDEQVEAALQGAGDRLPPEIAAAIAWIEAVIAADGGEPADSPAAALLPESQRAFLTFWTRFDLLVHDLGLFFLPHAWIEQARQ